MEHVASQRLRAECAESRSQLETKKQEVEKLQGLVEELRTRVSAPTVSRGSREQQKVKEVDRVQKRVAHSERGKQSIRAHKVERVGARYSIFSNYMVGCIEQALKTALTMFHYGSQITWSDILSWSRFVFDTEVTVGH
jgi:hypothetical protein